MVSFGTLRFSTVAAERAASTGIKARALSSTPMSTLRPLLTNTGPGITTPPH
jgi:hypothetical protein